MKTLTQTIIQVNDKDFVGVATSDYIAIHRKAGDGEDVQPGLCNAWVALSDAIALIEAAGYVVQPKAQETEDEFYERLFRQMEDAQDARHDAVSAHWGHD